MTDRSVARLAEQRLMCAARIVGLLFVVLTAGCAGLQRAQPGAPPQTVATQGATVAVEPQAAPAASIVPTPAPMSPQVAPIVIPPTEQSPVKAESPVAKTPAKVPASPAPTAQVRKTESAAQIPAKQETPPPLDLKSLETRLKETKAIGVFTKLALKNQVDDLLNEFRAFYAGRLKITLAELRQPYEMLLLKVLALLQDADPPLAGAIVASREAIWGILADPVKFTTI
jgi:hypothetical protein